MVQVHPGREQTVQVPICRELVARSLDHNPASRRLDRRDGLT